MAVDTTDLDTPDWDTMDLDIADWDTMASVRLRLIPTTGMDILDLDMLVLDTLVLDTPGWDTLVLDTPGLDTLAWDTMAVDTTLVRVIELIKGWILRHRENTDLMKI